MGDFSPSIDVEKLMSYSDDLVSVLKDKRDVSSLTQCLEHSKSLQSSCDADFKEVQSLLEDYQKKIYASKQRTKEAKSEIAADEEIDLLQKELEEELEKEHLLKEDIRMLANELNDLERQRISVEERKQVLKKLEQDELKAQMKLSMYASVTNIIPNLDDQFKISGHIVGRDTKGVEKFEFDPLKLTAFDMCNSIWKMISS